MSWPCPVVDVRDELIDFSARSGLQGFHGNEVDLDRWMECSPRTGFEAGEIGLAPRAVREVAKLDSFVVELNQLIPAERNKRVHRSHQGGARPKSRAVAKNEGVAGAPVDARDDRRGTPARAGR